MRPAAPIAWMAGGAPGGTWGPPHTLAIPLDDRGLLLADGLFETVLVQGGAPRLLAEHLQRWHGSAAALAMAPPPREAPVRALLREAVARSGIRDGALRLNWSRGGGGRGLGPAATADGGHRFWLQLSPVAVSLAPVGLIVSALERRNGHSALSGHKTFAYAAAVQARLEARRRGAGDALLPSSRGGLACATAANVLVRGPEGWLTPPRSSGCLPGVMRRRALELGLAREQPLETREALTRGCLLLNSLGCRPGWDATGPEPDPAERTRRSREAGELFRALLGRDRGSAGGPGGQDGGAASHSG
jgi:branched-subunit amino acid aminotransferase/4-amino-4-deoxychorismate lyase